MDELQQENSTAADIAGQLFEKSEMPRRIIVSWIHLIGA